MKTKSSRICGRNSITVPRPANRPSCTRLRSGPSGIRPPTPSPSVEIQPASASCSGPAQLKTAWNIRNSTTARITRPHTGCSSQRSRRSSRRLVRSGMVTVSASSACTCACRSPWSSPGSGAAGTAPSSRASSAAAPSRFTAIVSTTGMPRRACSASTSMMMPRRLAWSIWLSANSIGLPSRRTSSTKRRCRRRLVASATQTSRSGTGSPGNSPWQAARVIASSGLVASRLYAPGRSSTRTLRPAGVRNRPSLRSTVTPA